MNKGYDNNENVHLLSKCSMLKPIVGTEIDFRSSLFLKKFTIVDFPELLRPMIKILICFGFLSLFKIFINNFSNIFTFFSFVLECLFLDERFFFSFLFVWVKILKLSCQHFNMIHLVIILTRKMKPLRNLSTQFKFFFSRKTTKMRTTFYFQVSKEN